MTDTSLEESLIAVDLGNGSTSFIAGNGARGSFPSLVATYKDTSGLGVGGASDVFETKDGNKFLVGHSCRDVGPQARSTDSSFYKSNDIRILLLKVLKECEIKNPVIVAGLPTEFFGKDATDFEENLRKWAKGEGYQVKAVKVIPQWAAPWFDDQLEDETGNRIPLSLVLQGKWGIIDIGQGTSDFGQFNNGRASNDRHGESKGGSDIHRQIFTSLSKNPESLMVGKSTVLPKGFVLDKQMTEHSVDRWLRDGYILWRGKKLDMGPISLQARNDFAKDVLPRGIGAVWGSTDFLNGMIVAGGGTEILGAEVMKQYVTCPMYKAADPEMSTVRGTYRFAKAQLLPKLSS